MDGDVGRVLLRLASISRLAQENCSIYCRFFVSSKEHGARIFLNLGCGVGRNSIYLGQEGFDVIGVDISRSALKKTRVWAKNEGIPNVMVLRCSMRARVL